MVPNLANSERSCDFNKQGRNIKHVRMLQAMPLEYFKANGFNRGSFEMTQNDPINSKIVIFSVFFISALILKPFRIIGLKFYILRDNVLRIYNYKTVNFWRYYYNSYFERFKNLAIL